MDGNGTVVDNDPFCEHIFWRSVGVRPFVANPVGMVTGFFMFVQGVIPNVRVGGDRSRVHYHPSLPGVFYLCKAELACVGIGTVLFHALSDGDAAWWHMNDGLDRDGIDLKITDPSPFSCFAPKVSELDTACQKDQSRTGLGVGGVADGAGG